MNYRPLGRTGLSVSEIGLGTWAFGGKAYGSVEETDALRAIHGALDSGVTFFDTAPLYGVAGQPGVAEVILGRGLGSRRDQIVLASKFGRRPGHPTEFHAKGARESVEASLGRLGTDRIDLLFFHSPFGDKEIAQDVWLELGKLQAEGKIRFIGHSVSKFDQTASMARRWSAERKIDVVQAVYSLLNRETAEFCSELHQEGIGIVARESLANGFLAGIFTKETIFPPDSVNSRYTPEELAERIEAAESYRFLVRGDVTTTAQAALRWVLCNEAVSSVLTGAKSEIELRDGLRASEAAPFTRDELRQADVLHVRDFSPA
jgi:aryl-alcohol dehydrogenase-like predicted oxidoreductase